MHISQLGWGYFVYDPAKQTMTSHEEMTEIRLGDRLTVRLEDVDLKERRINFTLLSNQSRPALPPRAADAGALMMISGTNQSNAT